MHLLDPQVGVGDPFFRRKSEDRFDLWADIARVAVRIDLGHVNNRRDLLNQGAKARFRRSQCILSVFALADTAIDAMPQRAGDRNAAAMIGNMLPSFRRCIPSKALGMFQACSGGATRCVMCVGDKTPRCSLYTLGDQKTC